MGVPDIQQAAKATDNFGLLKSSLEQCEYGLFLQSNTNEVIH